MKVWMEKARVVGRSRAGGLDVEQQQTGMEERRMDGRWISKKTTQRSTGTRGTEQVTMGPRR